MARQIVVEIVGDASKFSKATTSAIEGSTSLTSKLQGIGKGMVIGAGIASFNLLRDAVGGVVDYVNDSITAASDLNETVSKIGVVFGNSSDQIVKWGKGTATAIGMSKNVAMSAAGTYGNLFVSMGIGTQKAADMSTSMVNLAGDLASFNNASPAATLAAIQSGLVGETEPLRQFGINLNDAALRQQALDMGLVTSTKDVLPAAVKAQAAYALILAQSTTAQGDFARTSDGLANQQRIADAKMADLSATIGQKLLPVMVAVETFVVGSLIPAFERVVGVLSDSVGPAIQFVSDHMDIFGPVLAATALVITAVLVPAVISYTVAMGSAVVATIAAAAPFIAVGVAIAGVILVLDKLGILKWVGDTLRDLGAIILPAVGKAFDTLGRGVGIVFDGIKAVITPIIDAMKWIIDNAHNILFTKEGSPAVGPGAPVGPTKKPTYVAPGSPGYTPGFAAGGIVPGPSGVPMLAIVHGGETITPAGRGGPVTFTGNIILNGGQGTEAAAREFMLNIKRELGRQGMSFA
jgi:hypothetical protein